jgi:outer membrane lipoprotein-sorting protein
MRIGPSKLLVFLFPLLSGCLRNTRLLQQPESNSPIVNPSVLQLVETVNQRYDRISSLTVTVDVAVTVGGIHTGEETNYSPCSGYLLLRKPNMLRVLILVPVLHTRAMDMVSDGTSFTLLMPSKNRAIEGTNTVTRSADNPLENLRPNIFVDTIMIHDIAPDQIVSMIQETTSRRNGETKPIAELPEYDLMVFGEAPPRQPHAPARVAKPQRVIHFNQRDLLPVGQDIYGANGELETQVIYGPDQDFGGVDFPSMIDINRPTDKYRIQLTVRKLTVNQSLADDSFALKIPVGMQVQKLQ